MRSTIALVAALVCGLAGQPAPGSAQAVLEVTGAVATPRIFTRAGLAELPRWTGEVSVATHSGFELRRYTGSALLDVLQAAGGVVVDEEVKNARIALYIVAVATDGYAAVVSWGELDPALGAAPAYIAWPEEGSGADARPSLVLPLDNLAGRHVHGLARLEVRNARP